MTLVHIEAGLRSNSVFHPFPEEITRRLVSRMAVVHFAPSRQEAWNLVWSRGLVFCTQGNTGLDTLRVVKPSRPKNLHVPKNFTLVSLHRNELFQNKRVLASTLSEIAQASRHRPVIFICDKRFKLAILEYLQSEKLDSVNITFVDKLPFPEFQYLLRKSHCLITDSGGQQEEAASLDIPCLIHRKYTERFDGLSTNALLSEWTKGSILEFVNRGKISKNNVMVDDVSPAKIVSTKLIELAGL
jgi:UDP-N-acetylglucosamine 2-epimerase (non-hydrolysing)